MNGRDYVHKIEFFPCTDHDSLSFLSYKLNDMMLLLFTIQKGHLGDLKALSFYVCEGSLQRLNTIGILI